jgi:hypothetical protein
MRIVIWCVAIAVWTGPCTPVAMDLASDVDPRCDSVDADLCDDAFRLAEPHLDPSDGAIRDIWIGPAGGAAECHPLPCPELIGVVVYYESGVEHSVILQVTGGLRVTGSERVQRDPPPPEDGGKRSPPGGAGAE